VLDGTGKQAVQVVVDDRLGLHGRGVAAEDARAQAADMVIKLMASRSGSRPAGMSPAAWALCSWVAITSITAFEFRTRGLIASAGSVSDSAK